MTAASTTATAREIADALAITDRRARQRAIAEAWPFTTVKLRGGEARLYAVAQLPADVQHALATLRANREAENAAAWNAADAARASAAATAQAEFDRAAGWRKSAAERRAAALLRVAKLREQDPTLNLSGAREAVAGEIGCSVSALQRWARAVQGHARPHWPALLLPEERGAPARVEIHPDAWAAFKRDYLRPEQPSVKSCYRRLKRQAAAHCEWLPLPTVRTFERRVRELSIVTRTLLRQGKEDMERLGPKIERSRIALAALEGVNADGHTFDVAVRFPDGSIGRPVLVGWQDIASGKLLSYRVGRSETAELVRLSFCDMVRTYGIPQHAYLDNGRAFASKQNSGGVATRHRFKVRAEDPEGVFTRAGVDVHWVTPYNGKAKPIERAWRDLADEAAKRPEFAGAYCGNSPNNKPENYGERAVDYAQFLHVLEDAVREHNARGGRRSQACNGRSFDATFADLYARSTVSKASESQLAMMLLAADVRMVRKGTGDVLLGGNAYWSEALVEHQGAKVEVRFDPEDLHAGVHAFLLDGSYLGFVRCAYQTGFGSSDALAQALRAKKQWRKKAKEAAAAEQAFRAAEHPRPLPAIPDAPLPKAKVIKLHQPKRKPAATASTTASASASQIEARPVVDRFWTRFLEKGGSV